MSYQLRYALAEINDSIRKLEESLGYDSLDGPPSHLVLQAADRLRVARRQLRDELGFAAAIPFPTTKEPA